jgi:Dyp-type peroxidase family
VTTAPLEPELELSDIQGIVVPGFLKPHQTLLAIRVATDVHLDAYRAFLAQLKVADGAETLKDRRLARKAADVKTRLREHHVVFTAIGFTYLGLRRLVPGASEIPSAAFKHGMARRSELLGDPTDPTREGHPKNWIVGRMGAEIDALIVVAGDDRGDVSKEAMQLATALTGLGVIVESQDGDVRGGDMAGHEHFGFNDGVSQPGIRGRASRKSDDFVTARHVDPSELPAAWLYGYPGQELVWPGEFVFGYPATSPDPLIPGPIANCGPSWTRNGSFLVYRRLRQDVVAFWTTMRDEAARLAALPGFDGITDVHLASLLVGRWPSGAPINRVPAGDVPALGDDALASNNFVFDADTPVLKLAGGKTDHYPSAEADPAGITSPWAAHIRKVNPRDSASDIGGASSTLSKRILRVGISFGESLPEAAKYGGAPDPAGGNRGVLFLSIQSSIEEQFEFLQSRWINDESRPKMPGGHDMIVGQNGAAADGIRRCTLFGGLAQTEVRASSQFVIPTGGAYLFVPSLSCLRHVVSG